jgi:hypothetical protein
MAPEPYIIPAEAVESSNLAAIGYDGARKVLAVTFKSGDVFHYANVAPELALELYNAESKGRFYQQRIKGQFSGQKMTGACPACGDAPGIIGVICDKCGDAFYADRPREAQERAS